MGGAQTHPARQRDGGLRFRIEEQMRGEGNTSYSRFRDGESSSLKIRPGRKTTMKTSHGMCQRSVLQKNPVHEINRTMEKKKSVFSGPIKCHARSGSQQPLLLLAGQFPASQCRAANNPQPCVPCSPPRGPTLPHPGCAAPSSGNWGTPSNTGTPLPGHPLQLGHPHRRRQRAP